MNVWRALAYLTGVLFFASLVTLTLIAALTLNP